MPRRRSRFKRLRAQLRAVGGVPSGEGETTNFYKYVIGQNKLEMANAIDGESRKLLNIALIPFANSSTTDAATERYLAQISSYSWKGILTRSPLDYADFGIYLPDGGYNVNPNYYPALIRATYSKSGATTNDNKVSDITGNKYSYTPKRSFSFPFGRAQGYQDAKTKTAETSIANVDELDASSTLLKWLKAGGKNNPPNPSPANVAESVSYEAEVFKPASSNGDATATAPANVTVS